MLWRTLVVTVVMLLTPTLSFAQKKAPIPAILPSPFANMLPLLGYVFVGLVVVGVGLFLHGAILKLLQRANLYKDPLQDVIEGVTDKVDDAIAAIEGLDTVIEGIKVDYRERIDGIYQQISGVGSSISALNDAINRVANSCDLHSEQTQKEIQRLLGVTSVLDQHIQSMRVVLDHDTHGLRSISERQQEMKDLYTNKIKDVQDAVATMDAKITVITGILQNEVFKERQTKAFEAIHELVKVADDISKAVQAGRDLPIGTPVPQTYCQSSATLSVIEKRLRGAVETLKTHRQQVDQDLMTASQTTVVLLEQLVSRVDRLQDRIQELTVGEIEP